MKHEGGIPIMYRGPVPFHHASGLSVEADSSSTLGFGGQSPSRQSWIAELP